MYFVWDSAIIKQPRRDWEQRVGLSCRHQSKLSVVGIRRVCPHGPKQTKVTITALLCILAACFQKVQQTHLPHFLFLTKKLSYLCLSGLSEEHNWRWVCFPWEANARHHFIPWRVIYQEEGRSLNSTFLFMLVEQIQFNEEYKILLNCLPLIV